MSSLSDYLEERVLNLIHNGLAFAPPPNWIALFTIAPPDATGGTEVSGGSYSRQRIYESGSPLAPHWTVAAAADGGFLAQNIQDVAWLAATASWGEIVAVGIFDAGSGGNLLSWHWLSETYTHFTAAESTDLVTSPGHALVNGDRVILKGPALPGGLTEDTIYFARDVSGGTLKLALTSGGAAINLTSDGAGELHKLTPVTVGVGNLFVLPAGKLRSRIF